MDDQSKHDKRILMDQKSPTNMMMTWHHLGIPDQLDDDMVSSKNAYLLI